MEAAATRNKEIRLGSMVMLQRDRTRSGEVVRLHRLGGVLYATVAWTADQTWSTDAPISGLSMVTKRAPTPPPKAAKHD